MIVLSYIKPIGPYLCQLQIGNVRIYTNVRFIDAVCKRMDGELKQSCLVVISVNYYNTVKRRDCFEISLLTNLINLICIKKFMLTHTVLYCHPKTPTAFLVVSDALCLSADRYFGPPIV